MRTNSPSLTKISSPWAEFVGSATELQAACLVERLGLDKTYLKRFQSTRNKYVIFSKVLSTLMEEASVYQALVGHSSGKPKPDGP